MSMNKCKIIGVFLLSFCIGFFINTSDVRATADGLGYSECYYFWEENDYPNRAIRPYVIGIYFYHNTGSNYESWASVGCGKATNKGDSTSPSGIMTTYGDTEGGDICGIDNYNDIFHHADLYKEHFVNNNGFKCPDNIYINKDNAHPRMSVYLTKKACDDNTLGDCVRTVPLKENRSQQAGWPSELDIDGWKVESQNAASSNTTTSQTEQFSGIEEDDGIKNTELIDTIVAAAGLGGYSLEDLEPGDPCTIVNSNAVIMAVLQFIIWIVCIGAILVLIIMTIMDFTKAVTASDDMGLKKAFQRLIKRAIAVVLLILLPAILTFVINFVNSNMSETGQVKIGGDGELYCGVVDE